MENVKRKVLFTNGMSNDGVIIITDAPKESIIAWCYRYNQAIEDGTYGKSVEMFDTLKAQYYVKVLHDSEIDDNEDIDLIGYEESYDLAQYWKPDEEELTGIIKQLIELFFDNSYRDYKGIDSEEFVNVVCSHTGLTPDYYNKIMFGKIPSNAQAHS